MRNYLGLLFCLMTVLSGVSGVSAASVTLKWTAPGDDGYVGQATTYDIRYSLSTITEANWASATKATGLPVPKVSGSVETFTVTGLAPNTVYYFALKVGDEAANWSALSNVTQKSTTQETIAPAAIANLSAGTATSTSVALAWTASGDDGNVGTASQYDIRYSLAAITAVNFASATKAASAPTPKIAGSAESFVISGLNAGTAYYFAVKAADEVPNWAAISNVVNRATLILAPAPPTLASPASGASGVSTSPTLTWNSSPGATSYRVQVSVDAVFGTTAVNQSNISATSLAVTGLTGNKPYFWRVSASNAGGMSANSTVWSFTTRCCVGRVGDVNGDGNPEPTIGDVASLIDAKFVTGTCTGIIPCLLAADINQSGGITPICDDITIGDISYLIDYLFITGPSLGLPDCL